jgi:2-polyprenyl-6-methoxyphenol hydroxylase-like FAD-dependent oxidoreductase
MLGSNFSGFVSITLRESFKKTLLHEENMQPNYDVVVVGAGPIGITTACTLKAIHNHLNICVIDKRPEPVRNHGLHINGDSVDKIQQMLESNLNESAYANPEGIKNLRTIFEGWRESFIRTSQIENDLAKTAHQMGITLLRDKDCAVTEANFAFLCSSQGLAAPHVSRR